VNAIFVYGLLKPGLSLYHVVEPFVQRASAATARGRLYDAGVPAARFDEDGEIEGLVFWLHDDRVVEALGILDELEDEGDQYRRIEIEARTDGGAVRAFAYEFLHSLDGRREVGSVWPA